MFKLDHLRLAHRHHVHLHAIAVTADGFRGYYEESLSAHSVQSPGAREWAQQLVAKRIREIAEREDHPIVSIAFRWESDDSNIHE